MQNSLALSAGLHVGVLLLAYFGVPVLFEPPPAIPAPIPVELVLISEITTPEVEELVEPSQPQPKTEAKQVAEPLKRPPTKEPTPKRQAVAAPKLPLLPLPAQPQETEVAALRPEPLLPPKPIPPEPKPKLKKVESPKAKPEPPKPVAKPATPPRKQVARGQAPKPLVRPQNKQKFDPTRISALLDKTPREKAPTPPPLEEKKRSVDDIKIKQQPQQRRLVSAPTISEIDFIRRQLLDCWYLPGGAKDLQNMRVTIRVELNSDGTLLRPPSVVDRIGRNTTDPAFFRTFEESALRAVRACTDPKNPLQLPPGEVSKWRDLEFTFDPRDMLG